MPVRFASGISALRSARALPDTLPLVGAIPGGSALASLTRWQSASSTPTRAGRRFLLDLSGGPGRKRLRRRIYIFSTFGSVCKPEISLDLRVLSPRSAPQSGLDQPWVNHRPWPCFRCWTLNLFVGSSTDPAWLPGLGLCHLLFGFLHPPRHGFQGLDLHLLPGSFTRPRHGFQSSGVNRSSRNRFLCLPACAAYQPPSQVKDLPSGASPRGSSLTCEDFRLALLGHRQA